ncbi:bifunctional UDP-sugar hydrolase/5'-nucleotidase [soil metagenome]|nr:bifunctional metallophosphatase/5'-nucleotidase [Gemmatimonadota bacterium]
MRRRSESGAGRAAGRGGLLAAILAVAVLAGCVPAPAAAPAPDAPVRLRVVHTNDFHGRLLPQDPPWAEGRGVGGSAVLAAHFDSARARFGGPTIVLSGGDDYQGTAISNMSWGRATVAVMNAKRYDAAALGNHEFDWGMDTLRARMRDERFPRMGANVYRTGTREHPDWVRPWAMIERAGIRAAVIGIALPSTPQVVMAGRIQGIEFGPEAEAIDRYAREARAAGADFVVVTMHVGAVCEERGEAPEEESRGCRGSMIEVAEALTEPVDLIVGGHTHQRVLTTAGGIPVTETAPYSVEYTVTDLERQGDSTVVLHRAVRTSWAHEVDTDTAVARIVEEWDEVVRPRAERVVIEFADAMPRRGAEHALGNLLADAYRFASGAQVGLVNNGGIRRDMPAGPITYGMLYELHPFQNELVTVQLTGAQLRAALETAINAEGRTNAHISGMQVRYDPGAPAGSRIREIRLDGNRILRDTDPVTLGTTDFVATGGDRFDALLQGQMTGTGLEYLDAIVAELQTLPQPIAPPAVGRWVPLP